MTITLRQEKEVALTHEELDDNFLSFYHSSSFTSSSFLLYKSQSGDNIGGSGSIVEYPFNRVYGVDQSIQYIQADGDVNYLTGSNKLRFDSNSDTLVITGSITASGGGSTQWNEAYQNSTAGYGKVGILDSASLYHLNDTTFKVSENLVQLADNIYISGSVVTEGSVSSSGDIITSYLVDAFGTGSSSGPIITGSYLKFTTAGIKWTQVLDTIPGSGSVIFSAPNGGITFSPSQFELSTSEDVDIIIDHVDTSPLTGSYGVAGISSLTLDGFGHVSELSTLSIAPGDLISITSSSGQIQIGTTLGTGTANRVPVWQNSETFTLSNVYVDGDNIGIGAASSTYIFNVPSGSSYIRTLTSNTVTVTGTIAASLFSGDGGSLTNVTPKDSSVTYSKIASGLKSRVSVTGTNVDWSLGAVFTKSLPGNTTLTFSNLELNKIITLVLSGNYTLSLPSYCKKISGDYDGTVSNYIQLHCTNANSPYEVWYTINQENA